MSAIPSRYVCSTCGGYMSWVGDMRGEHNRCKCKDEETKPDAPSKR